MNKLYVFLFTLVILFVAQNALATVGGSSLINSFKYNGTNESVYYILNSSNGRGCPPELMKMSLNSGKSQAAFSCSQGEELIESSGGYDASPVSVAINKITQNFKDLTPINLKDNRISIDVSFVNYENISPEIDEIKNANFVASIYQDNKKVIDFPISGCNLEQPFVFAGYAILGFDKKIILLLSTKGDCFEGGYIYESLHVVGGVNNLDKTYLNYYKGQNPLIPNEGTLVVFEREGIDNPKSSTETDAGGKSASKISYAVLAVVLGLGLGYFFGQKTRV